MGILSFLMGGCDGGALLLYAMDESVADGWDVLLNLLSSSGFPSADILQIKMENV